MEIDLINTWILKKKNSFHNRRNSGQVKIKPFSCNVPDKQKSMQPRSLELMQIRFDNDESNRPRGSKSRSRRCRGSFGTDGHLSFSENTLHITWYCDTVYTCYRGRKWREWIKARARSLLPVSSDPDHAKVVHLYGGKSDRNIPHTNCNQ